MVQSVYLKYNTYVSWSLNYRKKRRFISGAIINNFILRHVFIKCITSIVFSWTTLYGQGRINPEFLSSDLPLWGNACALSVYTSTRIFTVAVSTTCFSDVSCFGNTASTIVCWWKEGVTLADTGCAFSKGR